MKKQILSALLFLAATITMTAQEEDLLSLLGEEAVTDYATASFKTNRIINGHSIENTAEGVLDFKISHRFTALRQGAYDLFGLDGATIRFGLDYGITPNFMVGLGRNNKEKIIDGFAKYKIFRQSSGKKIMPLTLSYLIDAQIKTVKFSDAERNNKFSSRIYYTHQLLIGRKFNDKLTMQFMPTLLHRNLTKSPADKNDVLSMGLGGRMKLTKRVSLNAEYYYVLPNQLEDKYYNSLSLGFDIETGGHVFQLHFTNSQDMTYKGFITETSEGWFFKNDENRMLSGIRFGFNISRVFTMKKPKAHQ